MSTKNQTGGKWVSRRVQQQQQQAPNGAGSKIMEDSAIAAARIKEHESVQSPDVEVPTATTFEVQEATDALSNLYHNTDYVPYQPQGEPVIKPCQDSESFHANFLKDVEAALRKKQSVRVTMSDEERADAAAQEPNAMDETNAIPQESTAATQQPQEDEGASDTENDNVGYESAPRRKSEDNESDVDMDRVGHEVNLSAPPSRELEAVTQASRYASTQVGVNDRPVSDGRNSADVTQGGDEDDDEEEDARRNPTLGVQADVDAERVMSAGGGDVTPTQEQEKAQDESSEPVVIEDEAMHDDVAAFTRPTVTVTATLMPNEVRTMLHVPVHHFERDNGQDLTALQPDMTTLPPSQAAQGWVLIARELFESIAAHLCVHPQSFQILHRNERIRFMATLFLNAERESGPGALRPAPLWITIHFPSTSEEEDGPMKDASQLPPHLASLTANEVLERCVLVRRVKPDIDPATLVAARQRMRGVTYEEALRRLYNTHTVSTSGVSEGSGVGGVVIENGAVAVNDGTPNHVPVALVHTSSTRCPFLGGYRVKSDPSHVLLHAATQLFKQDLSYSPFPARAVPVGALCSRQTQTLGLSRGCQTRRECRVQTPHPGLALAVDDTPITDLQPGRNNNESEETPCESTVGVVRVVARPYFSAAALYALRTARVITLQKFYRQWKARQIRRALEAAEAVKQRRAEALQRAEEAAQVANDSREQQRRAAPRTWQDFRRRKQEITSWSASEMAKVMAREELTPQARRAALKAITEQELKLLQELARRQRQTALSAQDREFSHTLRVMASAKQWGAVQVETPNTVRAAELRELYEQLRHSAEHSPRDTDAVQTRLNALLQVKWAVKAYDSDVTRELCQLIDRESDLMHRGRTVTSLAGLRARIEKLFRRFIEDPEYNPGMAEYTRTATGRAKATQLYGTVYSSADRV